VSKQEKARTSGQQAETRVAGQASVDSIQDWMGIGKFAKDKAGFPEVPRGGFPRVCCLQVDRSF
jgi:hypothetical protein